MQRFTCVDIEAVGRQSQAATAEEWRHTRTNEIHTTKEREKASIGAAVRAGGTGGGSDCLQQWREATRPEEKSVIAAAYTFSTRLTISFTKKFLFLDKGLQKRQCQGNGAQACRALLRRGPNLHSCIITWSPTCSMHQNGSYVCMHMHVIIHVARLLQPATCAASVSSCANNRVRLTCTNAETRHVQLALRVGLAILRIELRYA